MPGPPLVSLAGNLPAFVVALFILGMGNSLLDVSMNAHAARVERATGGTYSRASTRSGMSEDSLDPVPQVSSRALHVPIAVEFPFTGLGLLALSWWAIGTRFLRGADKDQGQGASGLVLPSRVLLPLGVIAFCGFIAEGTVNDWSAVYLTRSASASAALASLGYFAFSVAMIAVRLVADRVPSALGSPA